MTDEEHASRLAAAALTLSEEIAAAKNAGLSVDLQSVEPFEFCVIGRQPEYRPSVKMTVSRRTEEILLSIIGSYVEEDRRVA